MGSLVVKPNSLVANNGGMMTNKDLNQTGLAKRLLNLIPKQIKERRSKNLYFLCEEMFTPGHLYENRLLYIITIQDDDDEMEEDPGLVNNNEEVRIKVEDQPSYLCMHWRVLIIIKQ